jgi:hypothetical protein
LALLLARYLDQLPGEGHLIVPKHWDEIISELLPIDPRQAPSTR